MKGKMLISMESNPLTLTAAPGEAKKKEKIADELAQVFYLKASGFPGFKQIIAKGT
jgi:hypothetical protein